MKKMLFVAAMLLGTASYVNAQTNIQEMYDFQRGHLTTTIEGFYADDWGSTFFFNDIYHPTDGGAITPTGYYTEIARALNFWKNSSLADFSLHVEWNGGEFAANAWLFGVEYFMHSADFRNTFTFELMYKNIQKAEDNVPLQFTAVWGCQDLFGLEKLRFSGFVDFWCEYDNLVVLSEPQLWYGIGDHFNIGGEVELSYNFGGLEFTTGKKFNVMPCIGTKWVF